MNYQFDFTSTHQDLLDAYDAERTDRSGMRGWARGLVIALGVMWLSGFAGFIVFTPKTESIWQPLIWLVLGCFIMWQFVLQPALTRRSIRMRNAAQQPVSVAFSPEGIKACVTGQGEFERSWQELGGLVPSEKGVLLYFSDGMRHWLPTRVFHGRIEREQFITFVHMQLSGDLENPE